MGSEVWIPALVGIIAGAACSWFICDRRAASRAHEAGVRESARLAAERARSDRDRERVQGAEAQVAGARTELARCADRARTLERRHDERDRVDVERARLLREALALGWAGEQARIDRDARLQQLGETDEDRRRLYREVADQAADLAHYRQILVDVENNSPPPIFERAPDDLKLIVGVGPVLERLLQKAGVSTFRQIARWDDHDIDAIGATLHEFRERIRRDVWVVQARELHYQKYGERLG